MEFHDITSPFNQGFLPFSSDMKDNRIFHVAQNVFWSCSGILVIMEWNFHWSLSMIFIDDYVKFSVIMDKVD